MGNLYILYSKSKDLGEFRELWKFQEISIFSFWDHWNQSFHDIPYMVILFPYKVMAETSNIDISKTTHRNIKIFSGMIFLVNIFHFMPKKLGVKKLANFPDYVPLKQSMIFFKILFFHHQSKNGIFWMQVFVMLKVLLFFLKKILSIIRPMATAFLATINLKELYC